MSDVVIKVENLSKQYRLGTVGTGTLSHDLNRWWARVRGKPDPTLKVTQTNIRDKKTTTEHTENTEIEETASGSASANFANSVVKSSSSSDYVWALKDINFEVKQGEVLGIIGKNGAGKSTLLKILSRVTAPTQGTAKLKGRVGSLLEVGVGFHPELTGRENIYLNGAIMGMTKAETAGKLDEIVEFSGCERYIDTPVKRYSSGMKVRLGFAVAAHLDPEILIVDEVLAVGDAEFQKKCLGKMGDVAKEGRTVLFVSHNMHALSFLCPKAMLLEDGTVRGGGPTHEMVREYLLASGGASGEVVWSMENAPGTEVVKLRRVAVLDELRRPSSDADIGKPIAIEMEFWCLRRTKVTSGFHVYNELGLLLFSVMNSHESWGQMEYDPGLYRCSCVIPGNFLNEGTYSVNAYLSRDINREVDARKEPAVFFRAHDMGAGRGGIVTTRWIGLLRPVLPWTVDRVGDVA